MKYQYYTNKNYLEIAKKEKVSILTAKVIEAYNFSNDKNLKLKDPYSYKGMQDIVSYLLKAINSKKKIMVYGDYDVDGICSISILKRMFNLLETNIGYYVPNRYKDGYGINTEKILEISEKGYEVIICIDNGINALEPIKLAKEKGIDVIVLDHHELMGDLPECNYYLHPNLSNFTNYNMCASSVAYYLSIALLGYEDELCSIYAGIATLSDIMPLVEQNKLLVKNAIKALNSHKYKNLDLLVDNADYDEQTLTMYLIPKLNSLGRMLADVKVNNVIKYLFSNNPEETNVLLNFINNCNETRKSVSNEFYNRVSSIEYDTAIVVKDDELQEGVCGIIASRLVNNFKVPSIVFALNEDKTCYKGSGRSTDDIDIVSALSKIDYLVNFGGHKKAAGLTINAEDFEKFKEDFNRIISKEEKQEIINMVVEAKEDEITYKSYLEIQKFSPFGEANPYPVFMIENINKNKVTFSKDKKHLLIKLNEDVTLLAFNLACKYDEKYNNYSAVFTLDKNNIFKNKLSCKCLDVIGG